MSALTEQMRQWFASTIRALDEHLRLGIPRAVDPIADRLGDSGQVVLIAFGKAARPMSEIALQTLPAGRVRGLIVPPAGDDAALPPLEVIPGGHPLPTEGSMRAARRALELCAEATHNDHVVFLVSGGGSAMLEMPIDPTIPVEHWRSFYQALIGSGAGIDLVNTVRRRLSAVKGGRLAVAAEAATSQTTLFVVDVPGDLVSIASGPTMVFENQHDTLREDVRRLGLTSALPPSLVARIERGDLPQLPRASEEMAARCAWLRLLDESDAAAHAATCAHEAGLMVETSPAVDEWPVEPAAHRLLERLEHLHRQYPGRPVAIVSTGELVVPLPNSPGKGGRNQQFALHCAERIDGRPIAVLSCGTDGIDGNSPAAGAVVDGTTVQRARALGLEVHDHLTHFDAFPLLDAIGDTVMTGPTGTNVRDLRLLVHSG